MVEKVTKMLIKVDLQCSCCYRKIRKILCEFPQIRDQTYDEKQNMVLITVVCCSPEKIRQNIICKGGEIVQSIEILPEKPKEEETPKVTKKPEVLICEPPKETAKPPAPALMPALPLKAPEPAPLKPPQQALAPLHPPVPGYPMVPVYPMVGVCYCPPFYGGYGGGPCYCGRRRPVMCYDGCGRPAGECQGDDRGSHPGRGRPATCYDGCGRPAGECQGDDRGSHPGRGWPATCYDGCGRPADECQGGNRGSYTRLGRPVMCDDGCGRPACECQGGSSGTTLADVITFSEENAAACIVM